MLILLFLYITSGVVLIVLSLPLMAGKVKPNPFYGFRIEQTLKDPALWYATNRYFARWQLVVGLIVLIAALGLYFWPGISVDAYALSCLAVFTTIFVIALWKSFLFIKKMRSINDPHL